MEKLEEDLVNTKLRLENLQYGHDKAQRDRATAMKDLESLQGIVR